MEGTTVVSIADALTTALQTAITETMSMIGSLLPIALGLVTAGIVIGYGIKLIKRVTGKA